MKTTKEMAELFSAEMDKIATGEVRKDVICGLEKCANALVKLARLEMDYAWKNWEGTKPSVPWVASSLLPVSSQEPAAPPSATAAEAPAPNRVTVKPKAVSQRIEDLKREMAAATAELANPKTSATMRQILQDKVQAWSNKIAFFENTKGKAAE